MNSRLPLLLIVIFAVITGILFLLRHYFPAFDFPALLVANTVMLLLSVAAWALLRRHVAERPQAFIRGVYGATMLRLFVCLAGILTYALLIRSHLHKPTLFVMFGIYMVYTMIETAAFSRTAKKVG